jgi:hypothetical protein
VYSICRPVVARWAGAADEAAQKLTNSRSGRNCEAPERCLLVA